MKWISVKDKLPKKSGYYLIANNATSVWVMRFSIRYKKFNTLDYECGDIYAVTSVTHWMPLPKPPKITKIKKGL